MKRTFLTPFILLIYLAGIAVYAYPGHRNDVSWTQYFLTVGITLACIVGLVLLLRRKQRMKEEIKKKKK